MLSVRQMAACVGVEGDFSVAHDVLGFRSDIRRQLSLIRHGELLRQRSFDVDLIRVGLEGDDIDRHIDSAVQGARDMFATVDITIRLVGHHEITRDESDGLFIIHTKSDGKKLCRRFRGANDHAFDVFIVHQLQITADDGVAGFVSRVGFGCNKDRSTQGGAVIGFNQLDGVVLAHEIGHAFGLWHVTNGENVMHAHAGSATALGFVGSQASEMREHCFMRPGCG